MQKVNHGHIQYHYKQCLGTGQFSTVYRGYILHNYQICAIKKIDLNQLNYSHMGNIGYYIKTEIKIMRSLSHPNLLSLIDVTMENPHIYIITEYCDGGDLSTYLHKNRGRLCEHIIHHIASQIMHGLRYLHELRIVHRDLKPSNILFLKTPPSPSSNSTEHEWEQIVLKIADFGFARLLETQQMAQTICGSPTYMSPEILCGHPYTDVVDLWSFGVILYEMISGHPPIIANNLSELMTQHKKMKIITPPHEILISTRCCHLLQQLLIVNPTLRITWEQFLNHRWFQEKKPPLVKDHHISWIQHSNGQYEVFTIINNYLKNEKYIV